MKQSQREDAQLNLLLEDYHLRASKRAAEIAPDPSPPRDFPADSNSFNGQKLHLLIEDYPARSEAWRARFERESAALDSRTGAPDNAAETGLLPLQLLVDDYAPAERFHALRRAGRREMHSDLSAEPHGTAEASAISTPAEHISWQDAAAARSSDTAWRAAARCSTALDSPAPRPSGGASDPDLNLLVDWDDEASYSRRREGRATSAAVHALLIVFLILQPRVAPNLLTQEELNERRTISLTAPPPDVIAQLTQKEPNKGQVSTEFSGITEAPRPFVMEPAARAPAAPVTPPLPNVEPPEPKIEVEPPKPEAAPAARDPEVAKLEPPAAAKPVIPEARTANQGEFQPGTQVAPSRPSNELPAPRRPTQPDPKPKLEFETPSAAAPGRESERIRLGDLTLNRRPDQVIEGAVENLSRGGGVRQAVGDTYGTGGLGGYLPPSPGNQGSDLELLSDPKGVDFRPYLLTVLASVRRNWYAVIPESARLAITRGKTTIQFAIVRNGSVSKLVIANSSGTQSLDRAAVAGISASNPFPPLPAEYPGSDIRLQFVFLYNIKTK